MKATFKDFVPGRSLYFIVCETVYWVIILTEPRISKTGGIYVNARSLEESLYRKFFLGDLGIEGYAYDDRPCYAYTTREDAENNLKKVVQWRKKRGKRCHDGN